MRRCRPRARRHPRCRKPVVMSVVEAAVRRTSMPHREAARQAALPAIAITEVKQGARLKSRAFCRRDRQFESIPPSPISSNVTPCADAPPRSARGRGHGRMSMKHQNPQETRRQNVAMKSMSREARQLTGVIATYRKSIADLDRQRMRAKLTDAE